MVRSAAMGAFLGAAEFQAAVEAESELEQRSSSHGMAAGHPSRDTEMGQQHLCFSQGFASRSF